MKNGKNEAAGNGKRDFRPTNLFVHTDVFPDPAEASEADLRSGLETTSLTFEDEILCDGGPASLEDGKDGEDEEPSEEEDEGYCWRNFWCFCCDRARRRRRRKRRREGRKRESDYGVLIIVVGLVVFSVFYFFSRTSVYKIIPLQ